MSGDLLFLICFKGTREIWYNYALSLFGLSFKFWLTQVRRGADRADIYSLALSPTVKWLAVSSDKGTVHIFRLRVRVVGEDASNENVVGQGPGFVHQNSSSSLDTLISSDTGTNRSSSLSFMKGEEHYSHVQSFFLRIDKIIFRF